MAIGLLVWVRDRSQLLKLEQCCCQCRDVLWLECIIELPWRHRFAAAAAAADSDMLGYMSRAVVRPTVNVGVQSIARTHSIQSAITVSEHLVVRLYETLHQSSHFRLVFHARKKTIKWCYERQLWVNEIASFSPEFRHLLGCLYCMLGWNLKSVISASKFTCHPSSLCMCCTLSAEEKQESWH